MRPIIQPNSPAAEHFPAGWNYCQRQAIISPICIQPVRIGGRTNFCLDSQPLTFSNWLLGKLQSYYAGCVTQVA
jgi:hypothetical protein